MPIRAGLLLFAASAIALAGASAKPALDDAADVDGFVAGFLEAEMRERDIPGAVFVLVHGDSVRARGFGLADVGRRVAVDPDRTPFRVASVSKLFTAAAAMQLVEAGALGLDDDVNQHLRSFRIEDAFGEPVRVRHLLTHTGGFDDRLIGMAASTEALREPLLAHLKRRMPRRVMPPGRAFSYSNYGMALLGAIVEEVSGRPFEAYVEERILRPLRMAHSSFAPGPGLRAELATGYALHSGVPVPLAFDFANVAPAGGLVATGADMGRFVAALLGGGALGGARILKRDTLGQMLRRQFTHDPTLPGVGLGFMERRHGDLQTFEHPGDIGGFASLLFLVPEADVGFFLSSNVDDLEVRERFVQAFLERYFPSAPGARPSEAGGPPAGSAERIARAAGWYRWNRLSRDHLTKPLGFPLRIDAQGDAAIRLVVPGGIIDPIELREVAPWHYEQVGGDYRAALRAGAEGPPETLFLAAFGMPFAFDRLPRSQEPPIQLAALAGGSGLAVSALIGWPVAAWRRRRRRRPAPPPLARMATGFGLVASAGWVGLLAGLLALLARLPAGALFREPPPALPVVLAFGVVGALATFPFAASVLLALARGWWSLRFRLHFALVALGAVALLTVLHDWNLVGFHY